jgi:hypothetical protein
LVNIRPRTTGRDAKVDGAATESTHSQRAKKAIMFCLLVPKYTPESVPRQYFRSSILHARASTFSLKDSRGVALTSLARRWLFDLATPALGPRPVAEITAPEVLAVLRQVESGRTIGDGSEASGDHRASLSLRRRNRPSHE